MLTLRRLTVRKLCRANSQLAEHTQASSSAASPPTLSPRLRLSTPSTAQQQASESTSPGEEEPDRKRGRRRLKQRNARPNISLDQPREWNRPLAEGVLPAYDEALKLIHADSVALKNELSELQNTIKSTQDASELANLKKKEQILEVQSEINLPEVRWKFANAMADMSKPVYRHLSEQKWRNEGGLDLLMERLHQMHVVPDVVPDLHPSLDMHVAVRTTPADFIQTKNPYTVVEPGTYIVPQQTRQPPRVYANAFHVDKRLYTLMMVDPDIPDEANSRFQNYLHWLQPNVPISALDRGRIPVPSASVQEHTSYIPPHPQRGTPYHRYTILLIPQQDPTTPLEVPKITDAERLGFDVRAFLDKWGMDMSKGGGAHMFRQIWNDHVSVIYSDVLKTSEPRYGHPKKEDPYAELKATKRYV